MIFLANRANLDRRRLLTRIHDRLQTRARKDESPIEQVWYHTSAGNEVGVRATVLPEAFLGTAYPTDEAELQVTFDFPQTHSYDCYQIQWVESARDLVVGWHQDETHPELGECHFQIDHRGATVQRDEAEFLDAHPLNAFDRRTDDLLEVLDALSWDGGEPSVPTSTVR